MQGTRATTVCSLSCLVTPLCPNPSLACSGHSVLLRARPRTAALHFCLKAFVLHSLCAQFALCMALSVAALPSILEHLESSHCPALHRHAMATSTALKSFMQAPREQRVTALRSLGAEKMAQLEAELREARLTLFGPMPTSKAGKAPPPPANTMPTKPCPAQPPPPKEEPIPAPPKDPPTPRGPPPRDGTPHRERQAARGSGDPAPQRTATPSPADAAQQRPCKPGHWHNKQGKGKGPVWADVSHGDEWEEIPSADAAPSSAPQAQRPAQHPAPQPAQQPNMDVGWAAYFAYQKGVEKGKAQNPAYAPPPWSPQGWACPPPPPPYEEHRPAPLRPSKHVHSEVRWIKARDGSKRPVFQSHTGKICCAIECGNPFCRYDRLPCNKPLHSPAADDVHVIHRCSKCKELEA